MLNLFSIRTQYWKNGTQFIGRIPARIMGKYSETIIFEIEEANLMINYR